MRTPWFDKFAGQQIWSPEFTTAPEGRGAMDGPETIPPSPPIKGPLMGLF
jgi:hypothetical protein